MITTVCEGHRNIRNHVFVKLLKLLSLVKNIFINNTKNKYIACIFL